jgi:hypothetical protein
MRLAWPRSAKRDLLERQADFFGDHLAAGQDAMSSSMALRRSPKARRLDGASLEDATDVVDDQGRQRFAFDIFGDDEQRTASLGHLLQYRQQVADVRDLLVEQENERVSSRATCLSGLLMK